MAELRWILLGLGLLLIGGIWWRGTRGARQASGDADLRDVPAGRVVTVETPYRQVQSSAPVPPEADEFAVAGRDWGVSPFEPLTIKTTDFDRVPILDEPFVVESARVESPPPEQPDAAQSQAAPPPQSAEPEYRTDHSDRFAVPAPPPKSNVSERQKIISLRIVALGDARWTGQRLLDAFELQGLAYGRYQVFHRNHADGRSLFCVASLVEPGTFDLERMPSQEFRGVACFAVLPGALDPLQTYEALIATARRLAESLTGMVQDGKGQPLSPQRAAALREEVAQFKG